MRQSVIARSGSDEAIQKLGPAMRSLAMTWKE